MPIRSELKVGLIVIQSVIALALVVYFLGQFGLKRHGYTVNAAFQDASGIDKGSVVRLAGVQIGTVEEVFLSDARPVVKMRLQSGVTLYKNYRISIASGALIGEKYVQITPQKPLGKKIESGSTVAGQDAVQLDTIMLQVSDLVKEFHVTAQSVNRLLQDDEINKGIKEALNNITQATEGARLLAVQLQGLVAQNETNINHTLSQVAKASDDVKATTGEIRSLISRGPLRENLNGIMVSLNSAARKADGLASQLQTTMDRVPPLMDEVQGTATDTRSVVNKVGTVVDDVRKVTADPQVEKDLKNTLVNVRQTSERLNDITASAQRILARAEKMRGIRIMPEGTELRYDFMKATRPQGVRADLNLYIPRDKTNFYQMGIFDATESNQLNFQFGRVLGSRTNIRWGIYASKLGIGSGYRISNSTELIADLYDPNRPQFDLRAYRSMNESWGLWAGWERLFGRNTFLFGARFRQF
ncbi:MAG: MCE family protein [Armatimonadetes bacterium]|nr:MCE family protein [Armatimonadota bacterium]